jgi:hypothetical protein
MTRNREVPVAADKDCIVNGEVSDSWVFGLLGREWRSTLGTEHSR